MNNLNGLLQDYLKIRRVFGYKLDDTERILNKFITDMANNHLDYITVSYALNWSLEIKHVKASEHARRLSIIRQFAHYCQAQDDRMEVPPSNLLPQHSERAEPYIYSDEQLLNLITACKTLPTRGLRHHTYTTFFSLMVITGCRLSELISLNNEDFQKKTEWLTVRKSKFNKSRLLPYP